MWDACSNDHVEIAKLLIEAKADVNKTNKVCSAVVKFRHILHYLIQTCSMDEGLCGTRVVMVT